MIVLAVAYNLFTLFETYIIVVKMFVNTKKKVRKKRNTAKSYSKRALCRMLNNNITRIMNEITKVLLDVRGTIRSTNLFLLFMALRLILYMRISLRREYSFQSFDGLF